MAISENNKQWLAECLKEIEQTLDWGDSSLWSNDDFERLSDRLFEKTNVRLSLSTLKRIWGRVRYDNFPTNATLNALVLFLNYENWRQFCDRHPDQSSSPKLVNEPIVEEATNRNSGRRTLWPVLVIMVMVLLGATAWIVQQKIKNKTPSNAIFKLESREVTIGLPNSVVFDYDASAAGDSTVMLQQSWDPERRELLDKDGKQHTSIYYYPGYFKAKLLIGKRKVLERPVFIKTTGWKGIVERKPVPVYLNDSSIQPKGQLEASGEKVRQLLNTGDLNNQWMQFVTVREFEGIDADDFTFEARLRNTATMEESICREIRILILGTNNVISIPLADKGCISNLALFSTDSLINGKQHDLSALGCDFSKMQQLSCTMKDHELKISLNDLLIYTLPFPRTMGRIVGVRLRFEGAGVVEKVSLATTGKMSYELIK